jgi:hypothetical protein
MAVIAVIYPPASVLRNDSSLELSSTTATMIISVIDSTTICTMARSGAFNRRKQITSPYPTIPQAITAESRSRA